MQYTAQKEKRLRLLIARNRTNPDFPKPEDFNTTEEDLDEYLYRLNPNNDLMQTQKKHLTIMGLLLIIPMGVLSIFMKNELALIFGLIIGITLCAAYYFTSRSMEKNKLQRLEKSGVQAYIEAVLNRDPEKTYAETD